MTDLSELLSELAQDNILVAQSLVKIQEGCDIISELKKSGDVIPTSAGVHAVDICTSAAACTRVCRVLISSLDANYLVKVATCTRNNTTATFLSSLVSLLRSAFVPSNEVSEGDQALERKCIYVFLQKIIKFRSFEQPVSLEVKSALSSATGMETGGGLGNEVTEALDAAFKAWDVTVGNFGEEADKGENVDVVKVEDDKKDTPDSVPDYTGGTPISDEGLVTAMPVANEVIAPPSTYAKEYVPEVKVPFHKRRSFVIFAIGSSCLAAILAAVISVVIIKPWAKTEGTFKPTNAPSEAATIEKFQELATIYDEEAFKTDEALKAAFDWMLNEDTRELPTDVSLITRRYALASFYFATGGDTHWYECSRNNETECGSESERFLSEEDECEWYGITCEGMEVNVIEIDYNNLNGTIPSTISMLNKLGELMIVGNRLHGTLPDAIGQLSDMTEFQCGENFFSGTLPDAVYDLQSLEVISFYQNWLSGAIPDKIGKMRNLKGFWFFDNYLNGTIPESVGDLGFLTYIDVKNNELSGSVPDSLWTLTELEYVDISANQFSPWSLPDTFASENIGLLNLGSTALQKSLPESFYALNKLKTFVASSNDITGSISESISGMDALEQFDLGYNRITGTLPLGFVGMENLNILILRGNELTGDIPEAYDSINLKYMFIQYNELEGEISESTCSNFELIDGSLIIADCLSTLQDAPVNCTCCAYCCDPVQVTCTKM